MLARMPKPLQNGQKKPRKRLVPDGRQLMSAAQARDYLGVSDDAILLAVKRHVLAPAKYNREHIYTRADLDRYRERTAEISIVQALERGEGPIAAYLAAGGAVKLKRLAEIIHDWARVASYWVVPQPPGSYARWLQRLGVLRVHTTDLRRMIELLCTDDDVARKARLALDASRAARLQAEAVRAQEQRARPAPEVASVSDAP